ncbi:MAG: cyclohexanecarboxylate-CoA ligase, partial [Mycobacterium sp.]
MPTDSGRAAEAYRSGLWTSGTLADSLRDAAQAAPGREILVDGPVRLDCRSLQDRSAALAAAMLARIPVGSVVSFMLPNWHEAAIVYHAA